MYMAILYQCTKLESKTTQSLQSQPSESLAWSNVVKKGIWPKKWCIDSSRDQPESNTQYSRSWWYQRISVVILNAHTLSDFQSSGFYGGAYSHYRMSYGTANSHSVGELQILDRQGHPVMLFSQIANPRNIKNLVQAEMKTIQYNVKELK
jgi:hypothetical protein